MKSKFVKSLVFGTAWMSVAAALATGCLDRPVGQQPPTTKVNFTSTVSQQAVDKVDLLFAIDNSASMGDKQTILKDAVPNLLTELIQPKCVLKSDGLTPVTDASGAIVRADPSGNKDNNYKCPTSPDSQPDFKPVTDMHIGIVSSSLGNLGPAQDGVCAIDAAHPRNDDHGLLVNVNGFNQSGAENGPNTLAQPDNFLSWFPQNDENKDAGRHPAPSASGRTAIVSLVDPQNGLNVNFQNMVAGIDQTGCGLEAQLESVYRFLIQPDPWDQITVDNFQQADMGDGINEQILKQRADFLRPDSLVAIIMLTDEDDSSADPLSVGGFGYAFMQRDFPGSQVKRGTTTQGTTAPRGTSTCDTDPTSSDCTSCGFAANCDQTQASCQKIRNDPNCTKSPVQGKSGAGYDGFYGPTDDDLNVRFFHMKQRYGVDPQYPLSRYINGFTKAGVPNRKTEHKITTSASGQRQIADYTGEAACTNPLFASKLPTGSGDEICQLGRSTRTPDLIFFAIVGGVPQDLLHFTPNDSDKSLLSNDDWVKILGKDPLSFNYDGIDPHMIQSITPRPQIPGDPTAPRGDNGNDKDVGRDWTTNKKDLQYACTFDLYDNSTGTPVPAKRSCVANPDSCDCADDPNGGTAPNPPLCDPDHSATQVKAKAYPTIRELELAHALGDQGIAASLCPIQLTDPNAATYGYKPAVAVLVDRLKNALTTQCLPQKLRTADQEAIKPTPPDVPCLVLVQLSPDSAQHCSTLNLQVPAKEILDVFKQQQKAESGNVGDGGLDLSALEVCVLPQADVAKGDSCADSTELQWCYVENDPSVKKSPAGRCPQALIFSGGTSTLAGARFSLQCIQQFTAGQAAGDTSNSSSGGH